MGGLILAGIGGSALWATLHDKTATLPAGQNLVVDFPFEGKNWLLWRNGTNLSSGTDVNFSVPLVPAPALQKLQWLADEARCQVSDNPTLMAGCIRERIAKVRAKALAYKERYEALRDLDLVYFLNLRTKGLVPMTTHIKPDAVKNGFGEELH